MRARLRLGATLVGFLIVLTELGFALYSEVSFHGLSNSPRTGLTTYFAPLSFPARMHFHLPAALLALASLIGGVAFYRAIRGRFRLSWSLAALAPLAAFLVVYKPPLSYVPMLQVKDAVLPWAAPLYWNRLKSGNSSAFLELQVILYVAAAAYILAIVLAIPRRRAREIGVKPVSA